MEWFVEHVNARLYGLVSLLAGLHAVCTESRQGMKQGRTALYITFLIEKVVFHLFHYIDVYLHASRYRFNYSIALAMQAIIARATSLRSNGQWICTCCTFKNSNEGISQVAMLIYLQTVIIEVVNEFTST